MRRANETRRRRRAEIHRAGEKSEGLIVCPVVACGVYLFEVVPDCGDCSDCFEPFRPCAVFGVGFECAYLSFEELCEDGDLFEVVSVVHLSAFRSSLISARVWSRTVFGTRLSIG